MKGSPLQHDQLVRREPVKIRPQKASLLTANLNLAEIAGTQTSRVLQKPRFLSWHAADGCLSHSQQFTGLPSINLRQNSLESESSQSSGSALLTWDRCHVPEVMLPSKARGQNGGGMLRKPSMRLCISGPLYTFHLTRASQWPWEMGNNKISQNTVDPWKMWG